MKITRMDRESIKPINADAIEALQMVADQYGLTLRHDGGTYSDATFTVKFTFGCETEAGIPAEFVRLAPLYGLTEEDFGREFRTYNGTYKITGINSRRRKYPISAVCVRTGKTYKFTQAAVRGTK